MRSVWKLVTESLGRCDKTSTRTSFKSLVKLGYASSTHLFRAQVYDIDKIFDRHIMMAR
jgi:hypothetical protein